MSKPAQRGTPCLKCGTIHQACLAHSRSGNPCRRSPHPGAEVCRYHGALAPQVQAKAKERIQVAKATAFLAAMDINPADFEDPMTGLLEEVTRSSRAVAFWGSVLSDLNVPDVHAEQPFASDLVGMSAMGTPHFQQNVSMVFGLDANRDLAPHVALTCWNQERERHARLCKMAIDAGVTERLVQRAEREAQTMVAVVMAVITDPDLGLTSAQQDAARVAAARELRAVDAVAVPSAEVAV